MEDIHENYSSLSWWDDILAKHEKNRLVDNAPARDRARLRCIADEFASCWLEPCPTESLGLRLSSAEFTVLVKWWLGLPVVPDFAGIRCPLCSDALDAHGDHLLTCTRRSAIQTFLWHLTRAAGLRVTIEEGLGGPERPGDLFVSYWKGGDPLAVDIVVTHPLKPSTPFSSVKTGREAVLEAEQRKMDSYGYPSSPSP